MISSTEFEQNDTEDQIYQNSIQYRKRFISVRWAPIICSALITIMNLSAWINLQGLFVEIPLIIPFTPERWALPSIAAISGCAANIVPVIVALLRWRQGNRFSEIPYIYMIIILGIGATFILAFFWQKTMFLFGHERSVWLLGCIFILAMLDCTSSLVFFDFMKRFRTQYLRAVFLGEALIGIIPTLLLIAQGIGGETICIQQSNSTILEPNYTQPRFSVRTFMFCITSIIVASLIAFILLRWTNIVRLADAAEPDVSKGVKYTTDIVTEENIPMITDDLSEISVKIMQSMSQHTLIILLILNTINSTIAFGFLPSLSTYSLLPFGQKAFYYWSVLIPTAYSFSILLSIYWRFVSNNQIIVLSILSWLLSLLIFIMARQSPCPWLADTTQGALIIITIWFSMSFVSSFLRITIGNRIKDEWKDDKGMFYYGGTTQLGSLLGSILVYFLINIFDLFIDRKPCQIYCLS